MSKRIIKIACWFIGFVVAVCVLVPLSIHTRTRYTCVMCRVEKTDYKLVGFAWEASKNTELTEWYGTHRPAHEHIWERSSCVRGRNIFGMTVSWGCGPIHPIGTLPPRVEREFLESVDEVEQGNFFQGILTTNRELQKQTVDEARDRVLWR